VSEFLYELYCVATEKLNLQKEWHTATKPLKKSSRVLKGLLLNTYSNTLHPHSWRPDGKLLAAGYSTGVLTIRHIGKSILILP
jgi:hypothetical protein